MTQVMRNRLRIHRGRTACGGTDDVEIEVRSHEAEQNKEWHNLRNNEIGRTTQERVEKKVKEEKRRE